MSNSNNNKTKNWLSRLVRIRRRSLENLENSNDQEGTVVYRRGVSVYGSDATSQQPRTVNSFRRSIIKMHTRMKNAFRHSNTNNNTNRHTIAVTASSASPSHSQIRITLGSPAKHSENIYSLEPTKKPETTKTDNISPQLGNSTLRIPSRNNPVVLEEQSSELAPLVPPRRRYYMQLAAGEPDSRVPKNEIAKLSNFYWYWGPISRSQAEERLKSSPDGAFLVRDSTSDRLTKNRHDTWMEALGRNPNIEHLSPSNAVCSEPLKLFVV